jgi:hypothetical protein
LRRNGERSRTRGFSSAIIDPGKGVNPRRDTQRINEPPSRQPNEETCCDADARLVDASSLRVKGERNRILRFRYALIDPGK